MKRAFAVALLMAVCAPVTATAADDTALRVSAPPAMLPIATRVVSAYIARSGRPVALIARSSRDGIAALRAGQLDLAISDSPAGADDLKQTTIAYAPLALVADPSVGVTSLSADQARRILDGTIASWRALGGSDSPVARFDRPSGTVADRVVMGALKLDARRTRGTIDLASPAIVGDVKATRGGVGVVVLPYAGDLGGLQILSIDGHAPDAAGARAGYPLLGAEFAVTLGAPTLNISRFVAFLATSSDLWRANGLVPVRDFPAH
jgi:phosphate transport system substrate-binding protein